MRINKTFIIFVTILLLLFLPAVNAQVIDDKSKYFEDVRGQLLSSYNAQVVSHTAILLGLIVAIASTGKDVIHALKSNRRRYRLLGMTVVAFVILLFLYESGRLFYWSGTISVLISLNTTQLADNGISFGPTNMTSCMYIISNVAVNTIMADNALTSRLAQYFHPNSLVLVIAVVIAIVSILIIEFYTQRRKKS